MVRPAATNATTLESDRELPPPEALPVGFIIGGRYAIKQLLGMGGNGAVYEGEHTTVGHRVAIKVIHAALANREDIMARFQREARICGTLRHPNIGQVYDFGTLEDGAPYMVMELQEGRSLADVLADTRLPIAAVVHITRQLLDGLGAAHRFNAVHRDVKPDNVMIVRDQIGEVVVKLVDFGISKSIGARTEHSVTAEGVVIGSPDYMSPEQLRDGEVDERTDIYSAGVLLYEAITGRLPFEHEKIVDLVTAILRDPFPAPRELRRDCPPELERVVIKALSRDPAQRYQSADQMSRALAEVQAVLRNASVSLVYLSEGPRTPDDTKSVAPHRRTIDSATLHAIQAQVRAIGRRPRMIAAGLGVAAALALVTTVVTRPQDGREEPERVVTTPLPSTSAHDTAPVPAAPVLVVDEETPAEREPAAVDPPAFAPPPSVSEPSAEPAQPTPAPKLASKPRRKPTGVEQPAKQAAPTLVEAAPAPPDPEALKGQLKQATTAFARGETGRARDLYKQVVTAAPGNADAWRGLGLAASRLGDHAEAARAFKRYLALRPNAPDAARIREQLQKVQ